MRITILSVAMLFLVSMTGCNTTGWNLGSWSSCGSGCGSNGCSSNGGCGSHGGCGSNGGCGSRSGCTHSGVHAHSHGICDCDYDDHCCTRQPWVRCHGPHNGNGYLNGNGHVNGAVPNQFVPATPPGEPLPAPAKLPNVSPKAR